MITLPPDSKAIRCQQCRMPAVGMYRWETNHFGRTKVHTALLCGTCGVSKADEVHSRWLEETDEYIYFKPYSNVKLVEAFNYTSPSRPLETLDPRSTAPIRQHLSVPVMMQLEANRTHDANLMDNYRPRKQGNRQWAKSVVCSGCHIKYTATRTKKCPNCGTSNTPRR